MSAHECEEEAEAIAPAPSWFLHCRGVGEARPELSGDTERRGPGSRAMVLCGSFYIGSIRSSMGRQRRLRGEPQWPLPEKADEWPGSCWVRR